MQRRASAVGKSTEMKCSDFISRFQSLEDPAAIEDAVLEFLPGDEPMRSHTIDTLAKMMQVDTSKCGEEVDMVNALVEAATLRVVQREAVSGRRSQSSVSQARVSMDDTLDMIKLVIVGDSGVGKTCLMVRFVKDEFVSSTRATIGMDFCTRQLAVDVLQAESENSIVQRLTVQVWDTAGQEQFHSLTATYYRKAGGVMIVYDAQNRASFNSLPKWLQQVDENAEGIVKMIVAAKSEGGELYDEVSSDEGRAFAAENGCLFASTSAKLGDGVVPAFKALSARVLAAEEEKEEEREGLWLNAPMPSTGKKKAGCC